MYIYTFKTRAIRIQEEPEYELFPWVRKFHLEDSPQEELEAMLNSDDYPLERAADAEIYRRAGEKPIGFKRKEYQTLDEAEKKERCVLHGEREVVGRVESVFNFDHIFNWDEMTADAGDDSDRMVVCVSDGTAELKELIEKMEILFSRGKKQILLSCLQDVIGKLEVGREYRVLATNAYEVDRFQLEGIDVPVPGILLNEKDPVDPDERLDRYRRFRFDEPDYDELHTYRENPLNEDMVEFLKRRDDLRKMIAAEMEKDAFKWERFGCY